jgi:hypothetical protein
MSKLTLVQQTIFNKKNNTSRIEKGLLGKFATISDIRKENSNGTEYSYLLAVLADGTNINAQTYAFEWEKGQSVFIYPMRNEAGEQLTSKTDGSPLFIATYANVRADNKVLANLFGGTVAKTPEFDPKIGETLTGADLKAFNKAKVENPTATREELMELAGL